jgi:hypothetical protein
VAFLPVQAAAEPDLLKKMRRHLQHGVDLVLTPALVRATGQPVSSLAGVKAGAAARPALAREVQFLNNKVSLAAPVEVDSALESAACEVKMVGDVDGRPVSFLTCHRVGKGRVWVLNVRTFTEADFLAAGEVLLAPKQLGLVQIPRELADALRASLLDKLGIDFHAPPGVTISAFGKEHCLYSFHDENVRVELGGKAFDLAPHSCMWH